MLVGLPKAGLYDVQWTIGPKNLSMPAKGVLQLEVLHEEPQATAGTSVSQLVELLLPQDNQADD
jgi:hypothetical protein